MRRIDRSLFAVCRTDWGKPTKRRLSHQAVEAGQCRLVHKVVDLLSEAEVWIIDETSFPKAR